MDAPKKIWAWVDDLAGIVGQSEAPETPPNLPAGPNAISPCAEYILASDHARIVAEKDARIAELEACAIEALQARVAEARNAALEDAAKVCKEIDDAYDEDWRKGGKSDSHLGGMSDGANECVVAIRALK